MHYCQSCDSPTLLEPADGRAVCPRCGRVGDPVSLGPLFVVTGSSGSGKSAVLAPLTRRLKGRCVVFDADFLMDGSEPLGNARWLAIAHCIAQSGLPTVLLGPYIPDHLEELPIRCWIGDIHVLLLDCPDELRRARINARPPWRSRDIEQQIKFGRWLRQTLNNRIDTSSGTPEETAASVAAWIDRHLTAYSAGA